MLVLNPPTGMQANRKAHMYTLMHTCTIRKSHFEIVSEKNYLHTFCDDSIRIRLIFDLLKYAGKKPFLIYI